MSKNLTSDWEASVRKWPSAITVAKLVETHGYEVAHDRWGWISTRTLFSLNRQGQKQLQRRAGVGAGKPD